MANTSGELADLILDEVEVAVVPGEAFGPSGFIRLSYALADDDLVEGVGRIQGFSPRLADSGFHYEIPRGRHIASRAGFFLLFVKSHPNIATQMTP